MTSNRIPSGQAISKTSINQYEAMDTSEEDWETDEDDETLLHTHKQSSRSLFPTALSKQDSIQLLQYYLNLGSELPTDNITFNSIYTYEQTYKDPTLTPTELGIAMLNSSDLDNIKSSSDIHKIISTHNYRVGPNGRRWVSKFLPGQTTYLPMNQIPSLIESTLDPGKKSLKHLKGIRPHPGASGKVVLVGFNLINELRNADTQNPGIFQRLPPLAIIDLSIVTRVTRLKYLLEDLDIACSPALLRSAGHRALYMLKALLMETVRRTPPATLYKDQHSRLLLLREIAQATHGNRWAAAIYNNKLQKQKRERFENAAGHWIDSLSDGVGLLDLDGMEDEEGRASDVLRTEMRGEVRHYDHISGGLDLEDPDTQARKRLAMDRDDEL